MHFRKFSFTYSNHLLGTTFCNYQPTQPIPSAIFFIQILTADTFIRQEIHRMPIKTSNVRKPSHWGALVQQFLQCKSNKYFILWVCVCSLRHPACNTHAPCRHLWPTRFYDIFQHYLTNSTILEEKKITEQKMCFDFSYNVHILASHSRMKWARYDQKCISVFM